MLPNSKRRRTFWDTAYCFGDHREHWQSPDGAGPLAGVASADRPPAGATVLDLGCGAGAEVVSLAEDGYEVIGLDSSPIAIDLARRRADEAGVRVTLCVGDVAAIPLADASVEMVLDRGCFHVVSRRRRPGYAHETARVLDEGGSLLLRTAREDDEEAGILGVDEREIRHLFAPVGFRCGGLVEDTLRAPAGNLAAWRIRLTQPRPGGRCRQ